MSCERNERDTTSSSQTIDNNSVEHFPTINLNPIMGTVSAIPDDNKRKKNMGKGNMLCLEGDIEEHDGEVGSKSRGRNYNGKCCTYAMGMIALATTMGWPPILFTTAMTKVSQADLVETGCIHDSEP